MTTIRVKMKIEDQEFEVVSEGIEAEVVEKMQLETMKKFFRIKLAEDIVDRFIDRMEIEVTRETKQDDN